MPSSDWEPFLHPEAVFERTRGMENVNPEWAEAIAPYESEPYAETRLRSDWDAEPTDRPVVQMQPTSFRSYTLRPFGTRRAAIRVVAAAPYPQRVLLEPWESLIANVGTPLVSRTANELDIPNAVVVGSGSPSGAYPVRRSTVLTLAPSQALYAAADTALPTFLGVSVSQLIPVPMIGTEMGLVVPSFKNPRLNITGTREAAIRVVPAAKRPQRVVIDVVQNNSGALLVPVRLTSAPNALNTPQISGIGADPADALFVQRGTRVLIVAPDQAVFATTDTPVAPDSFRTLSVSAYEVNPFYPRGATGTPGPAGRE